MQLYMEKKIRDAVTGKVDKVDGKAKRGAKNIDDAINLSVSFGSTSRKQGQVVDTNTYHGGTLVSDSEVQNQGSRCYRKLVLV